MPSVPLLANNGPMNTFIGAFRSDFQIERSCLSVSLLACLECHRHSPRASTIDAKFLVDDELEALSRSNHTAFVGSG